MFIVFLLMLLSRQEVSFTGVPGAVNKMLDCDGERDLRGISLFPGAVLIVEQKVRDFTLSPGCMARCICTQCVAFF